MAAPVGGRSATDLPAADDNDHDLKECWSPISSRMGKTLNERGYFEAYDRVWTPLANCLGFADLLTRLSESGALDLLRTPTEPLVVAAAMGIDGESTAMVLEALRLFGALEWERERAVLTSTWRALTDPAAFQPLSTLLAGQRAVGSVLRNLGSIDYWQMSTESRIAFARATSPDPYSDGLVEIYRTGLEKDRVGREIMRGGRFLELGCGVAGRILLTLRACPRLTAVGVELSEDLAAEAERRAHDLGVAERFTVVCGDATTFVAEEPFDHGFWSQFFFPDHTRAEALRAMWNSLKPSGSFQAPVGVDPEAVLNNPESAKDSAMWQAMLRSWGIPERTVGGLSAEVEAASFVDIEVIAREVGPAVRGWKPSDPKRGMCSSPSTVRGDSVHGGTFAH